MSTLRELADRFAKAPIWADDDDPQGFVAVDISPTERDDIVIALRGADALNALKNMPNPAQRKVAQS